MRQVDDVLEDSGRRRRHVDDVTEDDADGERTSKEAPEGCLSRFAYKYPRPSSRPPPSVNSAPSRPVRVLRKDHSDPQLVQLSKCIACGLQWTTRKTAKQKRTHIEHCAKKNALSKDTIKILIENEIAITPSSRIPANDPSENATSTLMDSVIPTGPLKKIKRHQVLPTVRSLPETRESILDRARDILAPTGGQAHPQPTQHFGQSVLARRNTQQPKRPALLDVNRSMDEPPSTQPFGASSLHSGVVTRRFGASMFAQDCVLSGDCHKRPASPPPRGSDSRTVRRRLMQ